ncbi:hypothetical protein TPR58_14805 [Sphingomonas sp. HF-S3]|uniref:Lipoprotein n=1 Tax=Sphingomonas rustica TaxID=3103142 RepID=A0ABV0BA56_9SPHN
MITSLALAVLAATGLTPATRPAQGAVTSDAHPANAQATCPGGDFESFLQAFISSADVRRKYTPATLEERSFAAPSRPGAARPVNPEAFEITMVDYSWADRASVVRWEKDQTPFTELTISISDLPGGAGRIEYRPGLFKDEGEGDGRTLIRHTGKPRAYVFNRVGDCWRLAQWLK